MYGNITPNEVAVMAAAGVKIEWSDVSQNLVSERELPTSAPAPNNNWVYAVDDPEYMLRRLHERIGHNKPNEAAMPFPMFKHITACRTSDVALVFVVCQDGKHVVIEDDWKLYPSDALITKLHLIKSESAP